MWRPPGSFQGLLSFEPVDIEHALESVRHASLVASQHRRPSTLTTRISSLVISENSGVGWIKGMTPVERHAELVYSECLLEKAVLGIGMPLYFWLLSLGTVVLTRFLSVVW